MEKPGLPTIRKTSKERAGILLQGAQCLVRNLVFCHGLYGLGQFSVCSHIIYYLSPYGGSRLIKLLWNWVLGGVWLWVEPLGVGFTHIWVCFGGKPQLRYSPCWLHHVWGQKGVELLALYPLPNYTVNHCGPSLEVSDRGDLQVSMYNIW